MNTWSETAMRLLRSMEVHADGISDEELTEEEMRALNALSAYGLVYKSAASQLIRLTGRGRLELHKSRVDPRAPAAPDHDSEEA